MHEPTPWQLTGSLRFVSRGLFGRLAVLQLQERRREHRPKHSGHSPGNWQTVYRWRSACLDEANFVEMKISAAILRP